MPKRDDIKSILVLGSGGIVIGQACEFDYSGTQAVRALKAEGYYVVLVNSNPATIMTDPEIVDRTYIEPLTVIALRRIIRKERPCALLPTVGGQTALNLAVELCEAGILEEFGVELLAANLEAISLAEDRQKFREAMVAHQMEVLASLTVSTIAEAEEFTSTVGFPVIVRPSFTLGGSGGGFANNLEELRAVCGAGLQESPVGEVLVEESISGWKEFELEVVRDRADNFVVVCTIENLDPMGVHTGDSITVAPAVTLTDPEYQQMRNWARRIMSVVGVETGGSNVQFAVDPTSGRLVVIEMNPRVSRSSALASKATGFPIAKVAARLAVGYTLDELRNEITGTTPCSFEPALDYVVVKIPRWDFAKFPGSARRLGPSMKSVGEAMAIGRTFLEALQKGFRSLEANLDGLPTPRNGDQETLEALEPTPKRLLHVMGILRASVDDAGLVSSSALENLHKITSIDPWFLDQLARMAEVEKLAEHPWTAESLWEAKQAGFSDQRLSVLSGQPQDSIRALRRKWGISPCYQRIDTCAAEFEARTPYLYSSYRATEDEAQVSERDKVIILGSGPNRIGQGIEFDYCCVHACLALREANIESVMVNCNPETVSTDYDTSDRLYFEPLTFEDVMAIIELERERGRLLGVIVQMGGQTPLNLSAQLSAAGVRILGNGSEAIDLCEDRELFRGLIERLALNQPVGALARNLNEAESTAQDIGYPVLLRPSYVLGGRAMAIARNKEALKDFAIEAFEVSENRPILIDQFLESAIEIDVDCLGDGRNIVLAGILQHIEEAGIHSGDSSCVIPPVALKPETLEAIRNATVEIGKSLKLKGLMNVQFAVQRKILYVIEVNPRASRTAPFLAKATGLPLARMATHLMLGSTLDDVGLTREPSVNGFFVKQALLPFRKFPGCDALLSPEMRSTGEVMGQGVTFGEAFGKAEVSAGYRLPARGRALVVMDGSNETLLLQIADKLRELGFEICSTAKNSTFVEDIKTGHIDLVINIPSHSDYVPEEAAIRRASVERGVPLITTASAATACLAAIRATQELTWQVRAVQDWIPSGNLSKTK